MSWSHCKLIGHVTAEQLATKDTTGHCARMESAGNTITTRDEDIRFTHQEGRGGADNLQSM